MAHKKGFAPEIPAKAYRRFRNLCCPKCREPFAALSGGERGDFREYDVLACRCGLAPVVAGIPILGAGITVSPHQVQRAVHCIRHRRYRQALECVLTPQSPTLAPRWIQQLPSVRGVGLLRHAAHRLAARSWTGRLLHSNCTSSFLNIFLRESGLSWGRDAYDYFVFRFGLPRHLVALAFCSVIQEPVRPILEVASGCGHITRSLVAHSCGRPVVGIDRSFFPLFVAKQWVAPEADYVCCAADAPLPFEDDTFSVIWCTDGLHYLAEKGVFMQEARRVAGDEGTLVMSSMRNARVPYRDAGAPLAPEGYAELVSEIPHRLVADSAVLSRYLRRQGPALERQPDLDSLASEPLLSMVCSTREGIFKDYGTFRDWPHVDGCLRLNPLYAAENDDEDGWVRLVLRFPGGWYEKDNAACREYLPETVRISTEGFSALAHGHRTRELEEWIARCVVLGVPPRYAGAGISSGWLKLAEYESLPEYGCSIGDHAYTG